MEEASPQEAGNHLSGRLRLQPSSLGESILLLKFGPGISRTKIS